MVLREDDERRYPDLLWLCDIPVGICLYFWQKGESHIDQ